VAVTASARVFFLAAAEPQRGRAATHIFPGFDTGSNLYHPQPMPTRTVSLDVALKRSLTASILKKMEQDKLSISALAERMGTGRTAVRRVLDAKNTSITFRSMSRAAQAVGLQIKLIAEPMSPDDLGKLARRLAKSKSPSESTKLANQITTGFYAEPDA
jgi:hypothetical protein